MPLINLLPTYIVLEHIAINIYLILIFQLEQCSNQWIKACYLEKKSLEMYN